MAAQTADVNWITVVASSALISALVNVGWAALVKHLDRNRERAKDRHRIDHVYLAVMLSLDDFAKRCSERLHNISAALHEHGDDPGAANPTIGEIAFKLDDSINWSELPVPFVAEIKELAIQFDSTNQWIMQQYEFWAGYDDACYLEEERNSYYGLKACKIVTEIRASIKAGEGETASYARHFTQIIKARRRQFAEDRDHSLIPELITQFKEEQSI